MDGLYVAQKLGFKLQDMENEKANHIADDMNRAEADLEDAAVVTVFRGTLDPPHRDAGVAIQGEGAPALEALGEEAVERGPPVPEGAAPEDERSCDLHRGALEGVLPLEKGSIAENPQRNHIQNLPAQKPNRAALEADLRRNPN